MARGKTHKELILRILESDGASGPDSAITHERIWQRWKQECGDLARYGSISPTLSVARLDRLVNYEEDPRRYYLTAMGKDWLDGKKLPPKVLGRRRVLIPDPEEGQAPLFGIAPGWHDPVDLLRAHKADPDAVQYIADMME